MNILDDEPFLNPYEALIYKASKMCNSLSDITEFGRVNGIRDLPEFIDLTSFCKAMESKNA